MAAKRRVKRVKRSRKHHPATLAALQRQVRALQITSKPESKLKFANYAKAINLGFGDAETTSFNGYRAQKNIIQFFNAIGYASSSSDAQSADASYTRIGRKIHVKNVNLRIIVPQDYCNTNIRFVLCQFRDVQYDRTAQNATQYFLNPNAPRQYIDNIYDQRNIKILKDKTVRVDTPNYGVANVSYNHYYNMKLKYNKDVEFAGDTVAYTDSQVTHGELFLVMINDNLGKISNTNATVTVNSAISFTDS